MTTITIERELLEQALEALDNSVDVVYEEYTDAVHRYANIPGRKARLDGLAAMAKAHLDTSDAIRAALAAPATAPDEQLRKDAERYRWLRKTTNWVSSNGQRINVRDFPKSWDEHIDDAIKDKP